jgi:hypothetical protein
MVSKLSLYQTFDSTRTVTVLVYFFYGVMMSSCTTSQLGLVPTNAVQQPVNSDTAHITLTKWQGNHTAAFTITSDHAWGYMEPWEKWFRNVIADSALPVDVDFTSSYIYSPLQTKCLTDTLLPIGCGVFAHGHFHTNTDAMSYDEALQNFQRCATELRALGIAPLVYAYPGGYGYNPTTRNAVRDAGYLAARMFSPLESPYIAPDTALQPSDWYKLPTLTMFSRNAHDTDPLLKHGTNLVHNTRELIPFLDGALSRRAWLITTYHAINRPTGNMYEPEDFLTDIAAAHARDLWIVSFNHATLYLYERSRARLEIMQNYGSDGHVRSVVVHVEDGLADDIFSVPLTLLLTLPASWNGKQVRALQGTTVVQIDSSRGKVHSRPTTPHTQHRSNLRKILLNILPNNVPLTVHIE